MPSSAAGSRFSVARVATGPEGLFAPPRTTRRWGLSAQFPAPLSGTPFRKGTPTRRDVPRRGARNGATSHRPRAARHRPGGALRSAPDHPPVRAGRAVPRAPEGCPLPQGDPHTAGRTPKGSPQPPRPAEARPPRRG
ncbi:Exonuclease SbcC [Actinacidiphila cocklensis]|uniref:Exonuclease SbcC n=1 Tax=Actinacidiphila cocklensis TaxID=887465 RepID=A0A9W4DLS7_9ACTN|nr:Exonuclease SbcC [Actinacidiphila cocklensis]